MFRIPPVLVRRLGQGKGWCCGKLQDLEKDGSDPACFKTYCPVCWNVFTYIDKTFDWSKIGTHSLYEEIKANLEKD